MYNCVALNEFDWCFQRYVWDESLDPNRNPEEIIIKTLIYGVKASGNLAEQSIRETAKLSKNEYPTAYEIIRKDIYVDNCLSGDQSIELACTRAEELEVVLNKGEFTLKGKESPDSLSEDGSSIIVAGLKWYTKEDVSL